MKGFEHLTEGDVAKLGKQPLHICRQPGYDATIHTCLGCQPGKAKPSKYRNVKVVVDGITFDSKREANYWLLLKARAKTGEINSLERQVPFALCAPDRTDIAHQHESEISVIVSGYVADFSYYDRAGVRHVVDAKGHRTDMYKLKRKWLELQDGIEIEEV
jgi:hypothetical protein